MSDFTFRSRTSARLILAIVLTTALLSSPASAGAPSCATYNGAGYCSYTGRVYQTYVNTSGQIILYFDTAMDPTAPSSVGISGVSVFGAAILLMSDAPEASKAIYSTLLAAQARGATISVQMWGTYGGYMKFDRVWIYE